MEKGRYFFTILLIIVVVITLGLLGYLAYDYISKSIIESEASDIVDEFEHAVITIELDDDDNNQNVDENQTVDPQQSSPSKSGWK